MNDTGRTILIVILVVIALPLLWGGMMMSTGGGMMGGMGPGMMGGWSGWGGGWSLWRVLLGIVPLVLVIGGIVAVVVWAFGRTAPASHPSGQAGARDILDARYARGEITREQYQAMRQDLGS